jgi:glycosyltransferase involved in cell wall biosynthesis
VKLVVLDANAFWTEQLFRQCARFADVLLLKPRDFRAHRAAHGGVRGDSKPRQISEGVWEQRLSMPPGWMFGLWAWSQHRFNKVIRAFAADQPVSLVLTYPQYRGLIPEFRPALSVYYNLDDYRDNWPRHRGHLPAWEAQTVELADLTVCIAAHRAGVLRGNHPAKASRIHHLPIGCTPEFMAEAYPHSPLRTPHSPTAGYIGALNYRFDFAFLAEVAALLPEVQFVLGGRVQEDGDAAWRAGLERARRQPNVTFTGWVEHAKLGEHLRAFDVLLMPYAHCHFNTSACPAKLWDYLGTGRPIVANDANPETLLWREVVRVGVTAREFAAQVQDALQNPEPAQRDRRLAIAREHTWEKLSERLEKILSRS